MFHRLITLIQKELIQVWRDRLLLVFALLGPTLQIIMLGNAISIDIQDLPVAVVDYDKSSLSREIVTALDNTPELAIISYPSSQDEARDQIDHGEVMAVVIIPRGFQSNLSNPAATSEMQVIVDGASSLVAARALGAAQGAIQTLVEDAIVTSGGQPGGISLFVNSLFNSTLDFRPDSITSQVGLLTFEITTLIAVMGIVREREMGTIEMLSITPLRRLELIAGKAITPLLIGIVDFLAIFTVSLVVFDVPIRGSFWLLLGLTVLYLMSEIGYALMISTITRSQQQAVTVVFVWVMLAMMLSGYLVPITTLPEAFQWISWGIPLRHYMAIVRGVMVKNAGLIDLWPNVLALALITLVMAYLTTRTLSRAIE